MIGRLRGTLVRRQLPMIMLEAGGVGYEVEVPLPTFSRLPAEGEAITLHVHMVVREDAQLLYGFWTLADRDLFRSLIRVSGVGPKVALALLSGMQAGELAAKVGNNDVAALVRVPGIGKKTAERLVMEMRDRIRDILPVTQPDASPVAGPANRQQVLQDAEAALVALGYKPQEAARMIDAMDDGAMSVEDLVRAGLRQRIGA